MTQTHSFRRSLSQLVGESFYATLLRSGSRRGRPRRFFELIIGFGSWTMQLACVRVISDGVRLR